MCAPLCGESLVRIAFLDEAGRSRHEPTIVVAGIVVHGDRTYRPVVRRLAEIRADFLPERDRKNFLFHATDIFHGSGRYFKNRDLWPKDRRHALLGTIARLPQELGMPIAFGYHHKAESQQIEREAQIHDRAARRAHFIDAMEHVLAFGRAEIVIETQMHLFPRNEICMVIAEDTDRVKAAVKLLHAKFRDPEQIASIPALARLQQLPLQKIEDTPHFASKAESAPLQVADTCAFLIMRRLARREDSQALFELIAPQLVCSAPAFGDPMGSEQIAGGSRY